MNTFDLRIFHSVVECGGFSAAARSLELPTANVSRKIIQLEEELGFSLLKRSTRVVVPSKAGQLFYTRTKTLCADLDSTIEEINNNNNTLGGSIRVQLLPAATPLLPYFHEFQARHPSILLDLVIESQNISLLENGIDLAIKVGDQADSNLKCRKLIAMNREIVASPAYLKTHNKPDSLQALSEHNCLRFRDSDNKVESELKTANDTAPIKIKGNFISNDIGLIRQSALLGQGIALLPKVICKNDIAEGRLIALLTTQHNINDDIWLIYPANQYQSTALQTLIDFLITSANNAKTS